MSIIADTLRRLQAKADDPASQPKEDIVQRPAFNKGEGSGRHRKDSPLTFLMVTVGMTITLGGFALATFWIGGHLDFGLGTTTQARVNDHRSLPRPLAITQDPETIAHTSEPLVAVASMPAQDPANISSVIQNDQLQATENFDGRASAQPSSLQKETTPSQLELEIVDSASTTRIAPSTTLDQPNLTGPKAQQHEDEGKMIAPASPASEEYVSSKLSPKLPTEITEDLKASINVDGEEKEGTPPDLIAMLSEEEIIQTEEVVKPSTTSSHSTARPITLAALKAQQKTNKHDAVPLAPLQPSPASRLNHAQELIRAGEYEDAASLLSPLFRKPPVKWQPWYWMGTALLGKGEIKEADQFFLSGLARNDKIPQLWIQRALVAQQRGDFQLAIHELRQAESLAADLPHIHLNMGYAYEQLGNVRMANQYYKKFLKLSENQPSFFSTRKKLFARLTQQAVVEKKPSTSPLSAEH